jgi:hypothetical protein
MRKIGRKSFQDLVNENKKILLSDKEALDRIEERLEIRHEKKYG